MLADSLVVPGSATRLLSLDQCRPELRELHDVWLRLRGDRRMPARRDFDPSEMRKLLPHIMLIDVDASMPREKRYRVRLHGTAQVGYQGIDWTGAYLHEKTDKVAAERLGAVGDHIVETREPWISTGGLYWLPTKPFSRFESILLPLSDDDRSVNMILG
jgi:hypothetical protein